MKVKIEKEKVAFILICGLVTFALVIYYIYSHRSGATTDTGNTSKTSKPKVAFEAPGDRTKQDKKDYKSTLDSYEEEQEKAEEQARVRATSQHIAFEQQSNNTAVKKKPETSTVVVQEQSSQIKPTVKKKPMVKQQQLAQEENTPEQQAIKNTPRRRQLNSATQRTVVEQKEVKQQNIDTVNAKVEIPVVVHGNQKVLAGQRIKLRVTKTSRVKQYTIDADQVLTGTVTFSTDHVNITVYTFRSNGQTVRMKLFALDNGELGIYTTGTTTNKQIASQSAQQMTQRARINIPTPLGNIPIGGGAGAKKINESEKSFEITSQYPLTLSDNP